MQKLEVIYNTSDELTKAILTYPGNVKLENTFTYQTINGNKVITLYDTAKLNPHGGARPRVMTYTFDAKDRLIKTFEISSNSSWYSDTLIDNIVYDNQEQAVKETLSWRLDYGSVFISAEDTTLYTREAAGIGLHDSYFNLFKNLYWFSISEYINNSFAGSLWTNASYIPWLYYRNPVKFMQTNSNYYGFNQGFFLNTFNADGLLTHAVYPAGFASKYDGKSIFDYTYVKVKK